MSKNIHTVYNSETRRWQNKAEGKAEPISQHRTKEIAEARGKAIAKESKGEHFIHGKDGRFQERNSYGNDPFPPRG